MKRKTSLLPLSLILFLLAGCQSPAPTALSSTAKITPTETSTPPAPIEPSPTSDFTLSATLQEVEGSVKIATGVGKTFSPAQNGTLLEENGQVRTLEDGYTRIDLSTGTLIRMAPLSEFTLISNEEKDESLLTRIQLKLGQIWVILNGGSVEVETPSGLAAVRGSYMMVEINPETQDILITCLEGNCSLENATGVIEMVSGQRAILKSSGEEVLLPFIEEMSERDFAEWLFFVPESEDVFPLLQETGILPWENWRDFIPDENNPHPSLDEYFPDGSRLPNGGGLPDGGELPNGGGLPDDGGLPDGGGLPNPLG